MPLANHSNIIIDNYGNLVVVSDVTGSEHDSTCRFPPPPFLFQTLSSCSMYCNFILYYIQCIYDIFAGDFNVCFIGSNSIVSLSISQAHSNFKNVFFQRFVTSRQRQNMVAINQYLGQTDFQLALKQNTSAIRAIRLKKEQLRQHVSREVIILTGTRMMHVTVKVSQQLCKKLNELLQVLEQVLQGRERNIKKPHI